jgi:NADPH-dependent 2,4-dienoyl-CoA reductase/sulfur reductase-like enzyme/rhodanese-related sulfurtransferase
MNKVIIIGGVAGGASAAARLRRLDEKTEIVMFERGPHISFANCGLPYYAGGAIRSRDDLLLQSPQGFRRRFNVDVRVMSEVRAINPAEKTVTAVDLTDGREYTEPYGKLILAAGAEPLVPPISGVNHPNIFTIRNIDDADRLKRFIETNKPETALVAGGGFIGVEMAENLAAAGLEVSLAEASGQVLASFDTEMACELHRYLRQSGVSLYLNSGVQSVTENGGTFAVRLNDREINADLVVMAAGVRPESRLAKEAGLSVGERGGVVVDEHMRTSDENIYAVGDVVEVVDFVSGIKTQIPLAGPANKQGRIAADNICGIPSKYEGTQGSSIIKIFGMDAAATGISEKTAKRLGLDYDKVYLWLPNHAGYYPGAKPMSMKVLFENVTGRLLGAQIIGFGGVDKRCDVLATAIRANISAIGLTKLELCYAPPYSSAKDPVNMAGFMIENLLTGKVKQVHWHDIDALPRDGSVTVLDVRTEREVMGGKIDGSVNIPLDDLRGKLSELNKDIPVYVHCHSGMRSYIAVRILAQNGFEAYNIAGGYRLYDSVTR